MRALLLLAIPFLATVAGAQSPAPTGITTLATLRDHFRPLLIFASRPDDPQLEIQLRTLNEHAADAASRDLVPIALVYQNPSPTEAMLSAADAEAARRHFNVPPGQFAVILIGKDGGEKLRATHPLSMSTLADTIDAMPMRQQEMRDRKTP